MVALASLLLQQSQENRKGSRERVHSLTSSDAANEKPVRIRTPSLLPGPKEHSMSRSFS